MEEITAPQGFIYVNKFDETLIAKVFVLGINDSMDNWELKEEMEVNNDI